MRRKSASSDEEISNSAAATKYLPEIEVRKVITEIIGRPLEDNLGSTYYKFSPQEKKLIPREVMEGFFLPYSFIPE